MLANKVVLILTGISCSSLESRLCSFPGFKGINSCTGGKKKGRFPWFAVQGRSQHHLCYISQ